MAMVRITFGTAEEQDFWVMRHMPEDGRIHMPGLDLKVEAPAGPRPSIVCELAGSPVGERPSINEPAAHLARMVAEHIATWWQPRVIDDMIRRRVEDANAQERRNLAAFCRQLLDPDDLEHPWPEQSEGGQRGQLREQMADEIAAYLAVHSVLDVEGFARFRLKGWRDELHDVVEYAIDEFVMERQYQEFISLLKYFVYMQEARMPVAHLIHKGAYEFELLDAELKPIEGKAMEGFVVEMVDRDMNYEDMIVSTLISVSPQQIYIHTREADLQVIKTIRQIFEGRAVLCSSCPSCRSLRAEDRRHNWKTT